MASSCVMNERKIEYQREEENNIVLDDECIICLEKKGAAGFHSSYCRHEWCNDCHEKLIKYENINCPLCRTIFVDEKTAEKIKLTKEERRTTTQSSAYQGLSRMTLGMMASLPAV